MALDREAKPENFKEDLVMHFKILCKDLKYLPFELRIEAINEIYAELGVVMQLEKELSVADMQKIVDANEKLVKELKDYEIHGK